MSAAKSNLMKIFRNTKCQFVKDQIVMNRELTKIKHGESLDEKKLLKMLDILVKYDDCKTLADLNSK